MFDHPQGDIVSLLQLIKLKLLIKIIILSLVTEVKKKYVPEDGQSLTETCWRILRPLKQYDHFNVLF